MLHCTQTKKMLWHSRTETAVTAVFPKLL